eukprot:12358538-Heterocapsa_arctica.AAC.1
MAMAEEDDDPVALHQRLAEVHQKLAVAMAKRKQGGHAAGQQGAVEGQAQVAPAYHAVQPEQGNGKRPVVASGAASQVELGGQAANDEAHSAPGPTGQASGKICHQPK